MEGGPGGEVGQMFIFLLRQALFNKTFYVGGRVKNVQKLSTWFMYALRGLGAKIENKEVYAYLVTIQELFILTIFGNFNNYKLFDVKHLARFVKYFAPVLSVYAFE